MTGYWLAFLKRHDFTSLKRWVFYFLKCTFYTEMQSKHAGEKNKLQTRTYPQLSVKWNNRIINKSIFFYDNTRNKFDRNHFKYEGNDDWLYSSNEKNGALKYARTYFVTLAFLFMWFIFLSFDKRMNNPVAHLSHIVSFCQWWNNCEWLLLIRTNKVIIFEGYKPPRHEITISNCSFSRCLWWCVNTSAYNIFLNCFINVLFLTHTATHYKSLHWVD